MTTSNVEVVQRAFEAIARGGVAEVADYFDENVEWHTDPSVPEAGVVQGKATVLAYVQGWNDTLGDQFEVELGEFCALDGDDVFGEVTFRGRPLGQGDAEARIQWCVIDTVRDGKIVRVRSFLDANRAREAAGLRQSP
jgi:ketosteroid isomerase-like protein